ncbi:hypothetical protein L7F22_037317 [Adiantum nelumboides]|nr:hypothetical protein [Adiantum nelumboides]
MAAGVPTPGSTPRNRENTRAASPHIRLVWADGCARDIAEATTAAKALSLSSENRSTAAGKNDEGNWLVCDSAALRVGKRPCPMHPEAQLETGRLYFVLPMVAFQQRLPWSYIASLAAMASAAAPAADGGDGAPPVAASAASAAIAAFAHRSRAPLLKSYLAFLLSRPRRRCRGFLAKLARSQKVNDAHAASHVGSDAGTSISDLSPARMSSCGAVQAALRNVCHSPDAHCKYVEQLIHRSHSWRPPLLTIHE